MQLAELLRCGVMSPDRHDSVMLTFAVGHDPVNALSEVTLRRLERTGDAHLPPSEIKETSIMEAYRRGANKIQNRLVKIQSGRQSLSLSGFQRYPKCGAPPGL